MQPRSILKWIILLCLIGLIIGIYLISTKSDTESMTTNYAPAHFLNTFNRPYESQSYAHVEGFADGEEEPVPVPVSVHIPASSSMKVFDDLVNKINIQINMGAAQSEHKSSHLPEPVTITTGMGQGPYGHMPNYETIDPNDYPKKKKNPDVKEEGNSMIFPPFIPDQPYNPIEVDPAKCPICPMNENQPWAEYRSLEDDVPAPY